MFILVSKDGNRWREYKVHFAESWQYPGKVATEVAPDWQDNHWTPGNIFKEKQRQFRLITC